MPKSKLQFDENERERSHRKPLTIDEVTTVALQFVRSEGGFAQVFTINRDGYPVGRTMGAPINDDWTVDLIQREVQRRIAHLRRNPRIEIVWTGSPSGRSTNDRPHVYDFGRQAPRVVFLRGTAEFMDEETTWKRFEALTAKHIAVGQDLAPARTREDVDANLVGILVRPIRIRAEGFGAGAESYTWDHSPT